VAAEVDEDLRTGSRSGIVRRTHREIGIAVGVDVAQRRDRRAEPRAIVLGFEHVVRRAWDAPGAAAVQLEPAAVGAIAGMADEHVGVAVPVDVPGVGDRGAEFLERNVRAEWRVDGSQSRGGSAVERCRAAARPAELRERRADHHVRIAVGGDVPRRGNRLAEVRARLRAEEA
jgi:hypothetical protein